MSAEELLAANAEFAAQVEVMTDSLGLRSDVYDSKAQHTKTTIELTTPAGSPATSILQVLVLDAVGHEFPEPDNNPHGFSAADYTWKFFHKHEKGKP